ncbi:hypothetical protein F0145_05205 [Adhaeribacter rhizoryzae]|uniref:Helix-turn-helix domain-containing protein n=1 Tax=Adhaeribacter rhizoryzae TaxID=2607907 RepID=A0A5M6DKP8_9BACT|nr:hypothetical protein F0145_05205 [Adhaeribacter rhizoryzae]
MKQVTELKRGYITLIRDERINVWHISIYIAFLYLWVRKKGINPLYITRKKVMKLAHISSIATYHKCIKQLQEFGYIRYVPSYNRFLGTQVFLVAVPD